MTSKKMLSFISASMQNIGGALAGHEIPTSMKKLIADRPDVLAKIYKIVTNLRIKNARAKTGFKIVGFPNYMSFLTTLTGTIEDFVATLSPEDQEKWSNDNNIIVITMKTDTRYNYSRFGHDSSQLSLMYADQSDDMVDIIKNGGSSAIDFITAVDRGQKSLGSSAYLMVMISGSQQDRAAALKTPTKPIVDSVEEQAKREALKERKLKAKIASKAFNAKRTLKTPVYSQLMDWAGGDDLTSLTGVLDETNYNTYMSDLNTAIKGLSTSDKKFLKAYLKYKDTRNEKAARLMLKEMKDQAVVDMILRKQPLSVAKEIQNRKINIRAKIKGLMTKILSLEDEYNAAWTSGNYTDDELQAMQKKIAMCKSDVIKLRKRLVVYRKSADGSFPYLSPQALTNRSAMIAKYRRLIGQNMAKGDTPSKATAKASKQMNLDIATTQRLQQDTLLNMANGMTPNIAAQQSAQQNIIGEDM